MTKVISPMEGANAAPKPQPSLKELTEGLTNPPKDDEDEDPDLDEDPNEETPQEREAKEKEEKKKLEDKEKGDEETPEEIKAREEKEVKEKEEKDKKDKGEGTESSFWEDVEKLTGEKVEVDFGDIEVDTPEGAAMYAKAFRDKGLEEFEKQLEKNYPREYKALQLAAEGINPSVLYETKQTTSYSGIQIDEKNIEQQKEIYIAALKRRGLPEEDILELLKLNQDTGKLLDKSKSSLSELQKKEGEEEKGRQEKANELLEKKSTLAGEMVRNIDSIIGKGQVGNLVIPESDKKALSNLLGQTIQIHDDGSFYLTKKISKENLEQEIQAEYFKMKKGDLSKLVERKAKTEVTNRLKKGIKDDKIKTTSSGKKTGLSLKDL